MIKNLKPRLLCSCMGGMLLVASGASAQSQEREETTSLDDIVVTATRQASSVNRVPLSISAMSQETLERQNITNASDLARSIPGLQVSNSGSSNAIQTITIRGVRPSNGASTTGVYLDDSPLTRRGGPAGSGTPVPVLFDLERVEVLRGPQGTLYGGGSQGGTVRFITPTPDLHDYSGLGRVGLSHTKEGDWSYEAGAAVGGPLIEDHVGFRASVYARSTGGYIDYVDRHSAKVIEEDANSSETFAARVAVRAELSERASITPSLYWSRQEANYDDYYWRNVEAHTAPARPNNPARSYGPYDFYGPYRSGDTCNIGDDYANVIAPCMPGSYAETTFFMSSLTGEYRFDNMNVLGVLTYIDDNSSGAGNFSYQEPQNHQAGYPFIATLPIYESYPAHDNDRKGFSAELRFSSDNPDSRLSWVGGVYYTDMRIQAYTEYVANVDDLTQAIYGLPASGIFGVPVLPGNVEYYRDHDMTDIEMAAYGEMTFSVTDSLKLIGGLRVSRTDFDYFQATAGPIVGTTTPTVANGGIITGKVAENQVSPKIGFQYLLDDRNSIFGNISNGYRVGGVNQTPPIRCAADMAMLGITSTPDTYDSDQVWNYELGGKFRVGPAQVNGSLYRLVWSDTQTNYGLPTCGFGYTVNAGEAVSQGFDLDIQSRLGDNVLVNLSVGYSDAEYTEGVVGPAPNNTVYLKPGDPLGVPEWKVAFGLQYDFFLAGREGFVRADYQYASSYWSGVTFGSAGYSPDVNGQREATNFVSMRAGIDLTESVQAQFFVENLFNSQDVLSVHNSNGRAGCDASSGPSCSVYRQYNPIYRETTFRPRTLGVVVNYRF